MEIAHLDIAVATVAFGMGIDAPGCRYVIHYDVSGLKVSAWSMAESCLAPDIVRGLLSRVRQGETGLLAAAVSLTLFCRLVATAMPPAVSSTILGKTLS